MSEAALVSKWADEHNLGYPQLKAKSVLLAASGDVMSLRQFGDLCERRVDADL